MELSYCMVNTDGREYLPACLEAIRRTYPEGVEHELLVLDNGSDDRSAAWLRSAAPDVRLIARERRAGLAENNNVLLGEARGRFCLLLNEDAELCDGAPAALLKALRDDPEAAAAGAQLLDPGHDPYPCAWRRQGPSAALASALFLHRLLLTQSRGEATRAAGWVQSSAMLVRRTATEEVGFLDEDFFVYSEDADFEKRLGDAGWRILFVPAARAVHHEQIVTDVGSGSRRVVEFHRGRDRYMRKHHSRAAAALARVLYAWAYVPRALAAYLLRGHDPGWYWLNARQALRPARGEGMREAAERRNRAPESGGPAQNLESSSLASAS